MTDEDEFVRAGSVVEQMLLMHENRIQTLENGKLIWNPVPLYEDMRRVLTVSLTQPDFIDAFRRLTTRSKPEHLAQACVQAYLIQIPRMAFGTMSCYHSELNALFSNQKYREIAQYVWHALKMISPNARLHEMAYFLNGEGDRREGEINLQHLLEHLPSIALTTVNQSGE